ncbi:MAG: TetR/AcrR family transcriptional regulator, partial [Candidatus Zixiibacteriota bacterium]
LEKAGAVTSTFRKLDPDKKERVYRAGLETFSSNVFDRVSFDVIAQLAEVSKGSLFQYFDNKENLLRFVYEIFLDDYESRVSEYFARERAVRARERIRSFLLSQLDFWAGEARYYRFYVKMRHENSRELTKEFNRRISRLLMEHVKTILARGARTGEIRQDVEPERIAEIILYILEGLTEAVFMGAAKAEKKDQMVARLDSALSLLFDGLKG